MFTQATLCTTTTVYGVLVHHQGAICTTKAQYHGAQGRLYFLKNSGDPDDLFRVSLDRLTGNVQGQGSLVKWVKTSLKGMILTGGLMSTSGCIF